MLLFVRISAHPFCLVRCCSHLPLHLFVKPALKTQTDCVPWLSSYSVPFPSCALLSQHIYLLLNSKLLREGWDISLTMSIRRACHKLLFANDILKPHSTEFDMWFQFENSFHCLFQIHFRDHCNILFPNFQTWWSSTLFYFRKQC